MPQRILLIEDDPRLAGMVMEYLRGAGFIVDHAERGEAGLARIGQSAYDALVLDLTLPDGGGLSLLQALRQKALPPETPVIVVSSRLVTRSELRSHKVTEFLPKPFDVRRLLSRVEALAGA